MVAVVRSFSAAVLCMEHKTDGLPPVTELRTLFPKIRLLVLSQSNPSYRWRSIPNTDAELSSPYSFTEISTMLENLGAFRCHAKNAIRRYGIELPANRQNALLGFVSKESPLGSAVMGKKVGDRALVTVNESMSYYVKILAIEKGEDNTELPISSY